MSISASGLAGGFVVDAWLGNCDIVRNSANIQEIDGAQYRLDNGNGLDIRAQGGRKPAQLWADTVTELEAGQGVDELGRGMRHRYPELTAQGFGLQVDQLASRFPDGKIDQLIDSIRRSAADRASLKRTLKARRDYIVSQKGRIIAELNQSAASHQDLALAA